MTTAGLLFAATFALALAGSLVLGSPTRASDDANQQRLVGATKCTWGPSYWCSGLRQSAKCGATKHCIRTIWESNPYPEDDDEVCKICKEMVQEARDTLQSNETMDELRQVFEFQCKIIPIKSIQKECMNLADEFVIELVETLSSEMNPDTVCAVAGLCNSVRIDKMLEKYHARAAASANDLRTDCDVCREQTQKMSLQVMRTPKNEVVDRALQLCGQLGSFADGCKLEVLDNFEDIYQALTHLTPVCDLSGVCSDAYANTPTTLTSSNVEDIECEFCTKVVQHWIDQWKANSTQEEFKEVLDSICKKLGQPDRINRCLHIVDDYYIPFFNYVLNELNAKEACAALGLCKANTAFFQVEESIPVSINLPTDASHQVKSVIAPPEPRSNAIDGGNQLVGGYFMPQAAQEMIRPGCVLCEFVMYRLQEWLQDDHTQEDIQQGLTRVCQTAPDSLKDQCQNLVDLYGPAIVQLLIQDVDPKRVCTVLNVCKVETETPQMSNSVNLLGAAAEKKDADSNCANCQYVLAIVLDTLEQRDNQDEVRNLLETACDLFPSSVSGKCEAFVDAYAEQVIQMIADNLSADEICQALQLCASPPPQDNKCIVCKYVVTTVDRLLEDEDDVEAIKESLEKACKVMYNQKLIKECQAFVDSYTAVVVDFIAHGATPLQVCQYLRLCPAASVTSPPAVTEVESRVDPKCTVCVYLVNAIDDAIEDPSDVEKVKEFLEGMCAHMPSEGIKKECKVFVDKYTQAIIDLIAHGATPEDVCAEIGLCSAAIQSLQQEDDDSSEEEDSSSSEEDEDESVEGEENGEKPQCLLCEYVMSELDGEVEDKQNQDEVRQALDKICYRLSKPLARQCLKMVDVSVDKIVEMISQDYTPEKVCSALKMCSKTEEPPRQEAGLNDISRFDNQHSVRSGPGCSICQMGMEFVEKKILNNRTIDMAEHAVLMMCSYIPFGSWADQCEEFVETYGDQIVHLIVDTELTPQEICTEIGLCDGAGSGIVWDASEVGGRKCGFGPALWCASRFHITQCGTAKFCRSRRHN